MTETILICDDDTLQRKMIGVMLANLGYKSIETASGREALKAIENSKVTDVSAVLLDVDMPEMDGFAVLGEIRKHRASLPVLMLTAQGNTDVVVKAIKAGANDFIAKPPNSAQLESALKAAIHAPGQQRDRSGNKNTEDGGTAFDDLIGESDSFAKVIAYGRKAATSEIPVLITGESGTGKELLARAIHTASGRAAAPFVAVNCSVIPEHTIEKVLIGNEKGTFVGATATSAGEFREARRGTLFMDDIHLLTLDAQAKLLRFIQEKEVEPVGSAKPVKVNIRLITSTSHDLRTDVEASRFRDDLFFRLNILTIHIQPLRERKEDVIPLVESFIQRVCKSDSLGIKSLSTDAKEYLTDCRWPGNVRELEGLIHRALILCEKDEIDRALITQIHNSGPATGKGNLPDTQISIKHPNGQLKTMSQIETEAWQVALESYQHNIARAAEALKNNKSFSA